MDARIAECQTLSELESIYALSEEEQRLVFEKRLEIFQRIVRWRIENDQLGSEPTISDTWVVYH